jgi:hypothetical protein
VPRPAGRPDAGYVQPTTVCDAIGVGGPVGTWAADCEDRCLPTAEVRLLCHQAGPPHVYFEPERPELREGAYVQIPAPPGACREKPQAFRVAKLQLDICPGNLVCTMEQIDGIAGRSWEGAHLGDCARQSELSDPLDYAQRNPRRYWRWEEFFPVE